MPFSIFKKLVPDLADIKTDYFAVLGTPDVQISTNNLITGIVKYDGTIYHGTGAGGNPATANIYLGDISTLGVSSFYDFNENMKWLNLSISISGYDLSPVVLTEIYFAFDYSASLIGKLYSQISIAEKNFPFKPVFSSEPVVVNDYISKLNLADFVPNICGKIYKASGSSGDAVIVAYQTRNSQELTEEEISEAFGGISIEYLGIGIVTTSADVTRFGTREFEFGTKFNGDDEDDKSNPYEPGGTSSPAGGGGSFGKNPDGTPEINDSQDFPDGSSEQDASAAGLYTRYVLGLPQLQAFGNWLWDTNFGLLVVKEAVSLIYGDPIQSIISVMSYPFSVQDLTISTNVSTIYWGNFNTQLPGTLLSKGSAQFDWGTIQLDEFWGNFLDYHPHTKIELYLPWCTGYVPIDPNDCLPGTLNVVTNFEFDKGTCTHIVTGNGHIIAQHSGVCGKQIPITALDTAGKALNLVTAAGSAIVGGLAGGGSQSAQIEAASYYGRTHNWQGGGYHEYSPKWTREGVQAAMSKAAEPYEKIKRNAGKLAAASSIAAFRIPGSVQRSGSFTGASAGCGVQYPYIILSRPTQSVPSDYGRFYGYPSNITTFLSNLKGYTEVGEIHLQGIIATEHEINEIDSLLKGGVIL